MADLMTIKENTLEPEVSMSNVQDVRAISTTGKSVRVAKANVRYPATQITVAVEGVTAGEANAAIAELKGDIDTLGTNKVNTTTEVIAGAGLTGGGTLAESRTINVVALNDSINVADDGISVAVTDLSGTSTTKAASEGSIVSALGLKENTSNKSNDIATDAASTTKYPSVKAIKDYADGLVAGLLDDRGNYDASGNVWPSTGGSGAGGAIMKGDMWFISVAGTLSGKQYSVGDSIRALVNNPGQTESNWSGLNSNITYTPEDAANKSTDVSADATSDTRYPSVKATKAYADTKVSKTGNETVAGVKTFSSSPVIPSPSAGTDAANKDYVQSQVTGALPVATAYTHPEIAFYQRWLSDSGTQFDVDLAMQAFEKMKAADASTVFTFMPHMASKVRTSGLNRYLSKMYSAKDATYDAAQATEATQPFVGGYIAPNSKLGMKLVLGQTQTGLMDFTDVVFAAADSWTLTARLKINKKDETTRFFLGSTLAIMVNDASIALRDSGLSLSCLTGHYSLECGRTYTIQFEYSNGAGLVSIGTGNILTPIATTAVSAGITFGRINYDSSCPFDGTLYYLHLANIRKSTYQSQLDHQLLSTFFPEVEGIGIGNQFWATSNFEGIVAGDGTVIPEVQGATTDGNAELIASTDLNTWTKDASVTSAGNLTFTTNAAGSVSKTTYASLWKPNRTILVGTSDVAWSLYDGTTKIVDIASGAFDLTSTPAYWRYSTSLRILLSAAGTITFTSMSNKECGAADSTLVYNYVYAATTGTASVKDLAATKAAAMWCYYNNDPALGAIYGKLYNWYAAHLFDLYPPVKGGRVPSKADFDQLIAANGGSTVAGGKLKAKFGGFDNANATNESGFSAVPGGRRSDVDGSFGLATVFFATWSSDNATSTNGVEMELVSFNTTSSVTQNSKVSMYAIRLLRNEPNGADTAIWTTGSFTTDIASTAKVLTIPCGYRVREIRVLSANNLTNIAVNVYDYANTTLIGNILTGKSVTANIESIFTATQIDAPTPYQDRNLRITATGNASPGMTVMAFLEKILKPIAN